MSQRDELKMQMLYGVNQADACQAFALGASSARIQQNLRDVGSRIVRVFLYDKCGPDPVTEWPVFVSYVDAVLKIGANPMITFAKMHKPVSDLEAVEEFANRSADVVRRCHRALGRRAGTRLVLVRVERAQQRVDQRTRYFRGIQAHLRANRSPLRAFAKAVPKWAQASHRRTRSRRFSALLARLGVAVRE